MVRPEISETSSPPQPAISSSHIIENYNTFSESKHDGEEKFGVLQLQPRLLVGGQPEGDAHQGVDVVASQQGQGGQLVLSDRFMEY